MAELVESGDGMLRAAETMLRASGGRTVLLRMPLPATGGDEAEQMGLATPVFNDVQLGPCVFRKAGSHGELLVSAVAVKAVVGSLEFDSANVLFHTAAGLVVDGTLQEVESVTPVESGGTAICYRVALRPVVG